MNRAIMQVKKLQRQIKWRRRVVRREQWHCCLAVAADDCGRAACSDATAQRSRIW